MSLPQRAFPLPVTDAEWTLHLIQGPHPRIQISFPGETMIVGRGEDCDLRIQDMKCSRKHVLLEKTPRGVKAKCVAENNPMFINGIQVPEGILGTGALLTIGDTTIKFQQTLQSPTLIGSTGLSPSTPPVVPSIRSSLESITELKKQPSLNQVSAIPTKRSPVVFILIAGAILATLAYLLIPANSKVKTPIPLKTPDVVDQEVISLQQEKDKVVQRRVREGKDSELFEQAQSSFLKGFRDYREGNYKNAIQSLDAARSLFPDHSQAVRYRILAGQKLEQQIQMLLKAARDQVDRNQYRLAISNYQKVIQLVDDPQSASAKEAKVQIERLRELLKGDL